MAHKLKPNLAFMGMDSLKQLISDIETNAKNSANTDEIPGMVDKLTSSVNNAISELES